MKAIKVEYQSISRRIINLKEKDLAFRNELIEKGILGDGYNPEMERIHNENANSLNEIIEELGYPSVSKVGKEANEAAWLVIQHSIGNPDFMRKCKELLEKAVKNTEANPIQLAYLSDRILTFEGKVQLYGTQFDWDENGELSPFSFDDLEKVNRRREELGLNSIEEQTEIIRERARMENQLAPIDYLARKNEMNKWRISTGWITN